MHRPMALLLFLLLFASRALSGEAVEIRATRLPLDSHDPALSRVDGLIFRGGLHLSSPDPRFGGLSGLWVSPDGRHLVAVCDQGRWLEADLSYDADGTLAGIANGRLSPLRGRKGKPLSDKKEADAEALSADGRGGFVVAFEREHRFVRYAAPDSPGEPIDGPGGLEDQTKNKGVEALTHTSDGRIVAFSENLGDDRTISGWLRSGSKWRDLRLERTGGLMPSDLARLPDGDLLLLERERLLLGIAVRLSRLSAAAIDGEAILRPREIARLGPPLNIDNMEGVAARRETGGGRPRTLVYLLSDDNFSALQRTLLLMFELAEP